MKTQEILREITKIEKMLDRIFASLEAARCYGRDRGRLLGLSARYQVRLSDLWAVLAHTQSAC